MKIKVIPTEFQSEGETIRGNFVLPDQEGVFAGICKFHGFPGSSDQIGGAATRLAEAEFCVLTFDFRGFRSSEGYFSLAGEIKDAQAATQHLIHSEYVSPEWLGIYAPSYGATPAVIEAIRNPLVTAVALRAPVYNPLAFAKSPLMPFTIEDLLRTAPNVVHELTNPDFRHAVLESMVRDAEKYNVMNEIHKLSPTPLFIITGDADKGIDLAGVQRLFSKANEPKEMVVIPGADHNLSNPTAFEMTMDAIVAWFTRQFIEGDYLGI
ncbi:MAG: alpha/beta hydrolase [Promethearchaeota archaeon]